MILYSWFIPETLGVTLYLADYWKGEFSFLPQGNVISALLFSVMGAAAVLLVFNTVRYGRGRWIIAALWVAPPVLNLLPWNTPKVELICTWWSFHYCLLLIAVFGIRLALIKSGLLTPILRVGIVAVFTADADEPEKRHFIENRLAQLIERIGCSRRVRLVTYGTFHSLGTVILSQTPIGWMTRSIVVRPDFIGLPLSGMHYAQEQRSYKKASRAVSAFLGQVDYLVVLGDDAGIDQLPKDITAYQQYEGHQLLKSVFHVLPSSQETEAEATSEAAPDSSKATQEGDTVQN